MKHHHWVLLSAVALITLIGFEIGAADTDSETAETFVRANCAECHALSASDRESENFSKRAERLGPPLDFAGNKFRKEWLVEWIQNPTKIRPAGVFPPRAVVSDAANKDQVDASLLPEHPSIPNELAEPVAEYLMGLRSRDSLIEGLEVKPVKVPKKMGELNFGKFKGCIACHLDQPERGGLSGPELYRAWERATPEFLFSYISNPVAWDENTLMPRKEMNDAEVEKLLGYLRLISEENQ